MVSKSSVKVPYSKMRYAIASILKDEGFIKDMVVSEEENKKFLEVFLKYVGGERVIHEIKRVSTPGCRIYMKAKNLKPVNGGLGISILSTSKGVMTNKQAKEKTAEQASIGGEIICTVW